MVSLFLLLVASLGHFRLVALYPAPPLSAITGPQGKLVEVSDTSILMRREDEPSEVYFERLTATVASAMTHYWTSGPSWTESDALFTGISVYQNYILWALRFNNKFKDNLSNYEFMSPAMALDRGYGFCSQVSKIIYSILRSQGYHPRLMTTESHAVVEIDGSVLDADYGVFIPYSINYIQSHPNIVAEYYSAYPDSMLALSSAYAGVWHEWGSPEAFELARSQEDLAEYLKWGLPTLGLLTALVLFQVSPPRRRLTRVSL